MLFTTVRRAVPVAALLAASLALGAVPAMVQPALAQGGEAAPSPADIEKAKAHFIKGRELFDQKNFRGAVSEFKESYRLSRNPLLLYNIGFTLDELGDKSTALFYYRKYLADAPSSDANRATAQTRSKELEAEIEQSLLSGEDSTGTTDTQGKTAEPPPDAPPARVVDKFEHNVIDVAPPGKPIDVTAFVPQGQPLTVTLFYRAAGEADFTEVQMVARYSELLGRIPAAKTRGRSVQYYIEVRDDAGTLVDRSGRATSPQLILIEQGAPARYYPDFGGGGTSGASSASMDAGDSDVPGGVGFGSSDGATYVDAGSSKYRKVKWVLTGTAVGLLAVSGGFYMLASGANDDLEAAAAASQDSANCSGTQPPCTPFSSEQQDLEARGMNMDTWTTVTFVTGGLAAVGAGVFWYLDHKESKKKRRASAPPASDEPSFSAAPVIGEGFIGGAAAVRF